MTRNILARIIKDESGATAIEYGLIVAVVAVVALAGFRLLGTNLNTLLTNMAGTIANPTGAGG